MTSISKPTSTIVALALALAVTVTVTACTEWHIDITTSTMTGNDTSQVSLVTNSDAMPDDTGYVDSETSEEVTTEAPTTGTTDGGSTDSGDPTTGEMVECPKTNFCDTLDCNSIGPVDTDKPGDCGVLEHVCLMWDFTPEFCEALAEECSEVGFTDADSCLALEHWGDKLNVCEEGAPGLLDECLCYLSCNPS